MLFGRLYELRIKIFAHRSLDKNKKAIGPYREKTKNNQVPIEIKKMQSSLVRPPMAERGRASSSRRPAGAGETGVHCGAWRGVVTFARSLHGHRLARSLHGRVVQYCDRVGRPWRSTARCRRPVVVRGDGGRRPGQGEAGRWAASWTGRVGDGRRPIQGEAARSVVNHPHFFARSRGGARRWWAAAGAVVVWGLCFGGRQPLRRWAVQPVRRWVAAGAGRKEHGK
jgi:hypothetical protein